MATVKDDVKKTALQYVTKAYVPRSVWKHRVCLPQPEHGPSKRNPGRRGCSSDRKPETRDTQKRLVRVLSLLVKPTRALHLLSLSQGTNERESPQRSQEADVALCFLQKRRARRKRSRETQAALRISVTPRGTVLQVTGGQRTHRSPSRLRCLRRSDRSNGAVMRGSRVALNVP